jgi:hypothetical protein
MPANRMNRDEFYTAMVPNDEARLRKILWTLYWRGNAQLRERIEDELRPPEQPKVKPKKELPDPDAVLDEVTTFVELAKDGAYMAGDRRVHHTERSRWRLTFRRLGHVRSLEALKEAEPGGNAVADLRSLVARFVAWHAHHHVAGRVSQYELAALTPGHYAEILQLRRQSTDIFRQAVIRGIEEGTFAAVDVHRVVRAILSLGVDLVRWYRTGGPDSPEQLGAFYADLALGMVTSAENNTASRVEQAIPASAISRRDPGPM